ncbi:MAG: TrmJ/YjtD family RNA methyltransferase [Candidatus Methanofastidiosa archaeon]|nr:TrmJ/YjtD family RNA methyltransferase [Candidatus Methanofastidiosa archaeon]
MLACILVEPESPGNVGSIARIMRNFSVEGPLILVNPCRLTDAAYMFACNAGEVLDAAVVVPTLADALALVDASVATSKEAGDEYNVRRIALLPEDLAPLAESTGTTGVIFGRESSGLTNDEVAMADVLVTIPTSSGYPTMNISHAAAVVFYELYRARRAERRPIKLAAATRAERDMLLADVGALIEAVEHRPHRQRIYYTVFSHVLGRAFLSSREAYTLKGILGKAVKRVRDARP